MSSPVQDVRSDVCRDVPTGSLHRHADKREEKHEEKALHAAPDIDSLCCSERNAATESRGHDVSNCEQAMGAELRCDIWVETGIDVVLKHVDKLDEVQPIDKQSVRVPCLIR